MSRSAGQPPKPYILQAPDPAGSAPPNKAVEHSRLGAGSRFSKSEIVAVRAGMRHVGRLLVNARRVEFAADRVTALGSALE